MLNNQVHALTAETLMRSRFCAYIQHDTDYLLKTWHHTTRPLKLDPVSFPTWTSLSIKSSDAGMESDNNGFVEFIAVGHAHNKVITLHERSRFAKENGHWFYVDGTIYDSNTPAAKIGRNAPCPCGSGKKSKKCCNP